MNKGNGNILAGAVGAFLFALIGGVLYFVVYQIGFIAGICGYNAFLYRFNPEGNIGFISN